MTDINKLNLSKYDVISVEKLEDLDSTGLLLRHKKSGARIAIVSNDDNNKVFSIGLRHRRITIQGCSIFLNIRHYAVQENIL